MCSLSVASQEKNLIVSKVSNIIPSYTLPALLCDYLENAKLFSFKIQSLLFEITSRQVFNRYFLPNRLPK